MTHPYRDPPPPRREATYEEILEAAARITAAGGARLWVSAREWNMVARMAGIDYSAGDAPGGRTVLRVWTAGGPCTLEIRR